MQDFMFYCAIIHAQFFRFYHSMKIRVFDTLLALYVGLFRERLDNDDGMRTANLPTVLSKGGGSISKISIFYQSFQFIIK